MFANGACVVAFMVALGTLTAYADETAPTSTAPVIVPQPNDPQVGSSVVPTSSDPIVGQPETIGAQHAISETSPPTTNSITPPTAAEAPVPAPLEIPSKPLEASTPSPVPPPEPQPQPPAVAEVKPPPPPPPTPAQLLHLTGKERARAEKCLANAVYFEARGELLRGQVAVAQVVMNRVFSPYYPKDVCSVVYQNADHHLACQFTFACDGRSKAINERGAWARAMRVAKLTLDGKVWVAAVAKSTHYHAYWVHPSWVAEMKRMFRYGVHTFYRPERWGDGENESGWVKPPVPGSVEAQVKPQPPAAEPKAQSASNAPHPTAPTTQAKLVTATVPAKPSSTNLQAKPAPASASSKPVPASVQAKLVPAISHTKPSPTTSQTKKLAVNQTKPAATSGQTKPASATSHTKPSPVGDQTKLSPKLGQSKPAQKLSSQ